MLRISYTAGMSSATDNASQLAAEIKNHAKRVGFDLVGIADASPSKYRDYYRQWLDEGRAGTMQYLHNRFEERTDPAVYLPGAKSVICVAINYHTSLAVSRKPTTTPKQKSPATR